MARITDRGDACVPSAKVTTAPFAASTAGAVGSTAMELGKAAARVVRKIPGWLGSVRGNRVEALGVEHFGQTGTIPDLYKHYQINTDAIVNAAQHLSAGRRIRLAGKV